MSAHARGPRRPRLAVLVLGLALVHAPSAYGQETEPSEADAASEPLAGSTSFEQLQTRVRSLAARHAQVVRVSEIGSTHAGRPLLVVEVGPAEVRVPEVLVVADMTAVSAAGLARVGETLQLNVETVADVDASAPSGALRRPRWAAPPPAPWTGTAARRRAARARTRSRACTAALSPRQPSRPRRLMRRR